MGVTSTAESAAAAASVIGNLVYRDYVRRMEELKKQEAKEQEAQRKMQGNIVSYAALLVGLRWSPNGFWRLGTADCEGWSFHPKNPMFLTYVAHEFLAQNTDCLKEIRNQLKIDRGDEAELLKAHPVDVICAIMRAIGKWPSSGATTTGEWTFDE